MPPNLGINKIQIENPSSQKLIIDSLLFVFKTKKIKILEHITINPKENFIGEFKITDLLLTDVGSSSKTKIFLYGKIKLEKIAIFINKIHLFNDYAQPRPFYLKKLDDHFSGTIKNSVLIGEGEKINNRLKNRSILGTDKFGRDIWTRLVYGTGIIIQIIFFSLAISVPLGILFGLIRGYFDNILTHIIGGVANFANSIPIYLLVMMIVVVFSQKIIFIVIAFALVQWIEIEELIYERVKILKKKNFILSAKIFGKKNFNIIFSEIFILCLPEIIISIFFLVKRIILIEASLSYFGYSVDLPNPSWGSIISNTRSIIYTSRALWILIPPTLAIILTAFSLNSIENYLRRRLKNNA